MVNIKNLKFVMTCGSFDAVVLGGVALELVEQFSGGRINEPDGGVRAAGHDALSVPGVGHAGHGLSQGVRRQLSGTQVVLSDLAVDRSGQNFTLRHLWKILLYL